MFAEQGDTETQQNLLGTLQKLSLRRTAQSLLIKLGIFFFFFPFFFFLFFLLLFYIAT
jgi:hypothetical protein